MCRQDQALLSHPFPISVKIMFPPKSTLFKVLMRSLEAMLCLSVTMFWIEAFWQPVSIWICMSASRETISHPQLWCCQSKKRLCLQCKSYLYNQWIVLRISFSNSTLSKGIKKDMLFVLDIMQVTFVTGSVLGAYCGFANNRFQLSGHMHGRASKSEQCYEAHAYSVPALGT